MTGTQHKHSTDVHTEVDTSGLFTAVEVIDGAVVISKGSVTNKWPLRKRYISFATNQHLLKRGAFIGHTPEDTLFLVRYLKGREDALVGMVEYYSLFDTTIIYISGKTVTTIDISSGEKKTVLESDERIGDAKILMCCGSMLLVCKKAIHRLEMATSLYTKLRLKVTLDPRTAEASKLGEQIQLVVSCIKGNVYVFETKKMEIIRSMKYFGAPISAIGFWKPEPSILFVLTCAGELLDVDYQNNRVLKRNNFPLDNYRAVVALKGKAMVFISSSKIVIYSPYTNSISTVYRTQDPGKHSFIAAIPDEPAILPESPKNPPEKRKTEEGAESLEEGALPADVPGSAMQENSEKIIVERPVRLDVEYSQKKTKLSEDSPEHLLGQVQNKTATPCKKPADIYESFEKFKDSVYQIHKEVLKEVFQLKKRLDKIERSLSK
ncbi:hypothetical protein NEMIN01_1893 [Nematocida minor]|uniref:uncharacterized protein n=1 Tax=Nematocida minor TaxID=1912983 RepID=UPI00221F1FAC|nr:uncharacterized protein NEMIN01_1893 [Nematocida minor]KAI5192241.1 hypothetical protein NEMIN01_1893 [Nematocida minor]